MQTLTMAADDTTTNNNTPLQREGPPPPSLLHLTTQIVASNIEKYPAGLWGLLSESQWNQIVRARVAQKQTTHQTTTAATVQGFGWPAASSPQKKKTKKQAASGAAAAGGIILLPALSAKHITVIEQHPQNAHLAHSTTSDELLWRHILNYKFRESGTMMNMTRPTSLSVPCGHVEKTLKYCGDTLIKICVEVKNSVRYSEFKAENNINNKNNINNNNAKLFQDSDYLDDSDIEEKGVEEEVTMYNDDECMQLAYQHHMKQVANRNLEILQQTCYTLTESPMDVQLLSTTKIGKTVSKAVKTLTKLKKKSEEEDRGFCGLDEVVELREIFWKQKVKWHGPIICYTSTPPPLPDGQHKQMNNQRNKNQGEVELTPLELLQKLLIDWKEMASDSGVEMRSDNATAATAAAVNPPKKKKRRMEKTNQHDNNNNEASNSNNNKYTNIRVTTCGREKHISIDQHLSDMILLHNSPDWRALFVSLTNRELELRKSHGERVRATREHLERDRPKIGKVILKRAVGRVRGGDVGLGGGSVELLRRHGSGGGGGGEEAGRSSSQVSSNVGGVTKAQLATIAADRKASRQEAILSKSKGLRAVQKQRAMIGGAGSASSTKVSQIRQTSKVAAKWSKSSFGNSVASAAGSNSGVRKVGMRKEQAQVQVSLQNGKTMKLPSNTGGKSSGKFSSLQQKMAAGGEE